MTDYYDPARRSPSISRRPGNRRSDTWIRTLLARVQVCRVAYRPEHHDIVFHSNLAGRVRANVERAGERAEQVCFEASEIGRLLPSNDPLELSMQYRSVIAFGMVSLLEDEAARQGREMRIAVAGCVAQAEGAEIIRRAPAVDVVVGPQSYHHLPQLLARAKIQGRALETEFPVEDKFGFLPAPKPAGTNAVAAPALTAVTFIWNGVPTAPAGVSTSLTLHPAPPLTKVPGPPVQPIVAGTAVAVDPAPPGAATVSTGQALAGYCPLLVTPTADRLPVEVTDGLLTVDAATPPAGSTV